MPKSEQDLVDDIMHRWRTDEAFRAWWRAYMRGNDTCHLDYLRTVRGFATNNTVAPFHPELEAARARQLKRKWATKKIIQQRQAGKDS